ncbi:hypothetical protein [Olivibacter sitiensis]|uniref:hypothetical protein n=1 Tax=Olivibacter sitiensis TaxID=376470 RepID=UPI0004230F70|nr:hypothetical protein [Olivibacter sitiensis]
MEIIAIPRKDLYSPNHIGNDRAVFSLTVSALEKLGHQVYHYEEDAFLRISPIKAMPIITMARSKKLLQHLQKIERTGVPVINSAFGIENCYRENMTVHLTRNGIPHPKSIAVVTDQNEEQAFDQLESKGYWIKRGDFHAIHKEDVSFVAHKQEGIELLQEFHRRNIGRAVISEHLPGDLVKFYGVKGTDFFHWFYPYDAEHQKFQEYKLINGASSHFQFNAAKLQKTAERAADVLGVHIYGGDAIVDASGDFKLIDMNDWPSFAPCREKAAPYIAQSIHHILTANLLKDQYEVKNA